MRRARVRRPRIRVHRNVPRLWMFPIRSMYLEAINRASHHIWMTHAYFIPDPDFIEAVTPLLPSIAKQGIKIVVNAGGLNPEGCRAALAKAAQAAGVSLKIALVEGDDLMPQLEAIRARGF